MNEQPCWPESVDFIPLGRHQTVRRGRVRTRSRGWILFAMAALGGWIAFWLAWDVLPQVVIRADADGRWQSAELNWQKTMLGRDRTSSESRPDIRGSRL